MSNKEDVNIELLYPNDLFLKGEELFENKAVMEISIVEKGLYNFIVKDGSAIEVEWFKPLTRYQKATCSCNFFKENKICKHAIAALIAYKDTLQFESPKKIFTEKNSTLNINNVLNGVSKEELKNFIKSYARSDKKFSTALKVQFARKVNLRDNEKKYKSLLDSVIKPISNDKTPIKISEVKTLLSITTDFYDQAQDSFALSEFSEVFDLCKVTLNKLCYIYHYTDFLRHEIEEDIDKNHLLLAQLLKENKSHELSEAILEFLNELIQYSYYPYTNVNNNGIFILTNDKKADKSIFDIIAAQLIRKKEDESQVVVLLAIDLILKYKNKDEVAIPAKYQSLISKVAIKLMEASKLKVCIAFCANYLNAGGDLIMTYLKAKQMNGDANLAKEMAKWFVKSQNLAIVDFGLNVLSETEQQMFREEVMKLNKNQILHDTKQYYFLARTNQLETLLNILKEKKDIRNLMTYDHYLVPKMEQELGLVYENLLESYLNQHIGNHSQLFIAEIFEHLLKIKASKISKKLGLMMDMKFSHRIGLEEIYKVQH